MIIRPLPILGGPLILNPPIAEAAKRLLRCIIETPVLTQLIHEHPSRLAA
jgi:hypothetical protein